MVYVGNYPAAVPGSWTNNPTPRPDSLVLFRSLQSGTPEWQLRPFADSGIHKCRSLAFFITLVVLALIIALTIFDQVGWADLVMLLVAFIPFALLILGRKWILQKKV